MTVKNPFNPEGNNAKAVDQYHVKDDVDSAYGAHHHTLGWGVNQAASGFDVKTALDNNTDNLNLINQTIADLQATQADLTQVTNDLVAQTAILAKVGNRVEYLSTILASYPNAAAAPYTTLSGLDIEEGNTAAEVGVTYSGNGAFTCLETGSYAFEVALNWSGSSTGRRIIFVNHNTTASGGNSYYRLTFVPGTSSVILQFHKFDMRLTQNDVVRFAVFQDSGASLARNAGDGIQRVSGSYTAMVGITRILG